MCRAVHARKFGIKIRAGRPEFRFHLNVSSVSLKQKRRKLSSIIITRKQEYCFVDNRSNGMECAVWNKRASKHVFRVDASDRQIAFDVGVAVAVAVADSLL